MRLFGSMGPLFTMVQTMAPPQPPHMNPEKQTPGTRNLEVCVANPLPFGCPAAAAEGKDYTRHPTSSLVTTLIFSSFPPPLPVVHLVNYETRYPRDVTTAAN